MKNIIAGLDGTAIDLLHMDVMDGHFVPQLSYGEAYVAEVARSSAIPLDVHLMVSRPELEVPKYFELRPHNITFHIEATSFAVRLVQTIQDKGIKAGIALNPSTPISALEPLLPFADLYLLMSIEPGFYGQSFLPGSLQRIRQVRAMAPDALLEVDGGVNAENTEALAETGVDILVAGSFIFGRGESPNSQARLLKELSARTLARTTLNT